MVAGPPKLRRCKDKTTRFDHLGFDDFEAFMAPWLGSKWDEKPLTGD
jgi:hypothetical protein